MTMTITHLVGGRCSGESANGVDRSIVNFARQQARLGHRVKLIGVSYKEPYPNEGLESVTSPPGRTFLSPSLGTREEILRGEPDVLHLHGAYVPIYPGIARFAREVGLPYVLTPHGNYSQLLLKRQPLVKSLYRRFMELPMAQRALFVHAIADQEEIRRYGVTAPIVSAINGIDLPELRSRSIGRTILNRFGVPESRTVFLFLGRLDVPQKGLDVLLRGFAHFLQVSCGDSDSHLVLAGPSWDGSAVALGKLATELGISDRVTLPGGVFGDEKAALISGCHFFVHPSRWEAGVPFSVLEALSYGKQCLVSPVIDQEGALQRAGVCQVCELDETKVAASLQILREQNDEENQKLALRARELIREEFSWEKPARALLEGYRYHLDLRASGENGLKIKGGPERPSI